MTANQLAYTHLATPDRNWVDARVSDMTWCQPGPRVGRNFGEQLSDHHCMAIALFAEKYPHIPVMVQSLHEFNEWWIVPPGTPWKEIL